MIQRDMVELSELLGDLDKDLFQALTDCSQFYTEIKKMNKYIIQNHNHTESNHKTMKDLNKKLNFQQQEFGKQLDVHKHRIEILKDGLQTSARTIKSLNE
ncbi:hypothetical protein DSO57_1030690, partial [Entomophthora muscae]